MPTNKCGRNEGNRSHHMAMITVGVDLGRCYQWMLRQWIEFWEEQDARVISESLSPNIHQLQRKNGDFSVGKSGS